MKKTIKLFILCWLLFMPVDVNAVEPIGSSAYVQISFTFSKIDEQKDIDGIHRTPPRAPEVYIDGNTLFFADSCDGCTLQLLLPESDVVVFSTVIAPGTTTLTLPYEGEYTIRIIRGDYCFTGEIDL